MSDATPAPTEPNNPGDWLGHPKGVFYLAFAEMWERFCFYGMRNILVLYMVNYFAFTKADAQAGPYAAYTSLIYCVAIFGGFIADKYIGYRSSILLGGIQMAAGMILLLFNRDIMGWVGIEMTSTWEDFFFYAGMATVIVGNGFFKPNISTIVGKIYPAGDPRRDGGFTIFYMGINIGALLGGVICAEIGQRVSWTLGFGVAAAGMLAGVFVFGTDSCRNSLMGHGEAPDEELKKRSYLKVVLGSCALIPVFYFLLQHSWIVGWILGATGLYMVSYLMMVAVKESQRQKEMIFALLILVAFNPIFWAMFEQAGGSLTLYADENLDLNFLGLFNMSSGSVQNFNALFIILLGPVFAALWLKLARKKKEPSIPAKFTMGLFQLGIGFLILVLGAQYFTPDVTIGALSEAPRGEDVQTYVSGGLTPLYFMVGLYLLLTMGELCISPVGLSMVTKLAPARMTGMVMGLWFLSIASANFLAGQLGALTGEGGSSDDTVKKIANNLEKRADAIAGETPEWKEQLIKRLDVEKLDPADFGDLAEKAKAKETTPDAALELPNAQYEVLIQEVEKDRSARKALGKALVERLGTVTGSKAASDKVVETMLKKDPQLNGLISHYEDENATPESIATVSQEQIQAVAKELHEKRFANYTDVYMTSFWVVMGATFLLALLIPLLKRWTHGVT